MRAGGAVPATIALVAGTARIGLDDAALEQVACSDDVVKVSTRDLATVAARGGHGATTVAATAHLAAQAGIGVFATGGLGGVHRDARDTWDESADLLALASLPITVVCAGVKSILDVGATLERLETLGVAVLGYRHRRLPRLLPARLRAPRRLAGRHAGRGRRRDARPRVAGHGRPRPGRGQPAARGRAGRPRTARPAAARRPRRRRDGRHRAARTSRRSCSTSSIARARASASTANIRIILRNAALAAEIAVAAVGRAP